MHPFELSNTIQCSFNQGISESDHIVNEFVDVFYVNIKDIDISSMNDCSFLSVFNHLKGDTVNLTEEKFTNLACNSLLRVLISKRLGINPHEISFRFSVHGKPELPDNKLFFNISHTKGAFAVGLSDSFYIGVDIESMNYRIDYEKIIKRFFSKKETGFILQKTGNPRDKFFLLWTRKEALLKALGTGIITNLSQIEVCDSFNVLDKNSLETELDFSISCDHFIYSGMIYNNYLSIALPKRAAIKLNHLDKEGFRSFLE